MIDFSDIAMNCMRLRNMRFLKVRVRSLKRSGRTRITASDLQALSAMAVLEEQGYIESGRRVDVNMQTAEALIAGCRRAK